MKDFALFDDNAKGLKVFFLDGTCSILEGFRGSLALQDVDVDYDYQMTGSGVC